MTYGHEQLSPKNNENSTYIIIFGMVHNYISI